MFIRFFLFFLCSVSFSQVYCQTITGIVISTETNQPLSFASVALINDLTGTICNENGEFEINIDEKHLNDTLRVSFMGYMDFTIPVNQLHDQITIELVSGSIAISEVLISPKDPTWYIKQAIKNRSKNYPQQPYGSIAYYNEAMKENSNHTKFSEAVFKSSVPAYSDTSKSAHQLLLFRQADNLQEMQFMRAKMEKIQKRREKQAAKRGEEYDKTAEAVTASFGGPDNIMAMDIVKTAEQFLDSTQFKKYEYSFAGASTYANHDVVVIAFKSKRKIDHMKQNGKIYIDIYSDAIVGIDFWADFVVPAYIKPLLYAFGLKIHKPKVQGKSRYRRINNTMYPENFQWKMNGSITKMYMFKKNEHAAFEVEQVFSIVKINPNHSYSIPTNKLFDVKEKMPEQVYNDEGFGWSSINVVKLAY